MTVEPGNYCEHCSLGLGQWHAITIRNKVYHTECLEENLGEEDD